MDIQKLKTKLGLVDSGDEFQSLSSTSDKPYALNIYGGLNPHFTFESTSLSVTYMTNNDAEMLVAIRDTIREFESNAKIALDGDKIHRWSSGPVLITATKLGSHSYKVVRHNKMVSSETEMSRVGHKSHILRKLGLFPQVDIRVDKPEDALYVFLANFESSRLDRNELKESLNWTYNTVCLMEEKRLKLPAKLDGSKSGMLARQVKAYHDGEEVSGILLNLRLGTNADVLIEDVGVVRIPKTDIWI